MSYEISYNTDANNSKANYTRIKSENRSKIDIAVRNLRIAPGEHQAYISVKKRRNIHIYYMSYNTDAHNSKPNYTGFKSENRSKIDLTVRNLVDIR